MRHLRRELLWAAFVFFVFIPALLHGLMSAIHQNDSFVQRSAAVRH